ncbi:MAG: hypothetical protein IE933_14420 [Sphingomonadales bacterium]|nr:hypothetical protein [Sphingomonadales bacterium]MBD3775405.1 hypothetical protein [Paracoccaceae bacterium]
MKNRRTLALLVASAAIVALPAAGQAETLQERDSARFAKLLEGREAGEPTNCIWMPKVGTHMQTFHGTALVFGRGKTVYVNYTQDPAAIDRGDTIVFSRFGSNLCDSDTATTVDAASGTYTGNVMLTKFIPYTRK